jgi:ABC-2 type transport system permease protein
MIGPPPLVSALPLVLVSMVLGWLISFCLSALIGLSAFVVEEVSAFEWIYSKFLLLLGGVLIPLDFLPAWLQEISQSLPFAYTIYGPARLFASPSWERFATLTMGQLAWLAGSGLLLLVFYRRCLSRLAINGG